MRGELAEMGLIDLIQVNCTEKSRALLRIRSRGREAHLYFDDGDIVHAQLGTAEGTDVLYHLLTIDNGSFELEKGTPAPKRTIHGRWNALLLEGMRRIDMARVSTPVSPTPQPTIDEEVERSLRALEIEVGVHRSNVASKEQELAWRLRELQGSKGAVVISSQGVVEGFDLDGDADAEAAIASFVTSGAAGIGRILALGEMRFGRVAAGGATRLVVRAQNRVASVLSDGTLGDKAAQQVREILEDLS